MATKLYMLCVIVCVVGVTRAFPTGAPISACVTMLPSHAAPRISTPPYSVNVVPGTYHPGDLITVTIDGGSTKFKGFFLQARTGENKDLNVGDFMLGTADTLANICGGRTTITHNKRLDQTEKSFTWISPSNELRDIQMVATVVQQFSTFWVKIPSSQLLTPTTVLTAQVDKFDLGERSVESVSICWTNVVGMPMDPEIEFTVKAAVGTSVTKQWIAIGFSSDDTMGDDSVVACLETDSGPFTVEASYNQESPRANIVNAMPSVGVTLVTGTRMDGVMTCVFNRKVNVAADANFFDLGGGQMYRLLSARGQVDGAGMKMTHSFVTSRRPLIARDRVDFTIPGTFTTLR